jgi:hypothetical protein
MTTLNGVPKRKYLPKGERNPSAAKAAIAAARPRDARGHFLPVVGDAVRLAPVRGGGATGSVDFVGLSGPDAG